jgi:TIR domain
MGQKTAKHKSDRPRLFLSYCHKDERWRQLLLSVLELGDTEFELWSDERIAPGTIWRDELNRALEGSNVAILLVTQNYLNSEFISQVEFPRILEAAKDRGLRIFWIAAQPSTHEGTVLRNYTALNRPNRTLEDLHGAGRRRALVEIANKIKDATSSGNILSDLSRRVAPQIKDERWRQTLTIHEYIETLAPKRIDILHFSLMTLATYDFWETFKKCRDVTFRILLLSPDLAERYSLKLRHKQDLERTIDNISLIDRQLRNVRNRPTVGIWFYESSPSVAALMADDDLLQLGWYFVRYEHDNPTRLSVFGLETPSVLLIGDPVRPIMPKIRSHFEEVLGTVARKPLLFGPDQNNLKKEWNVLQRKFRRR